MTNQRGEMISEWTVVGPLTKTLHGYRITAVERRSAPPDSIETRYPDGWRTTAVGPHIWRWTCAKPAWLARLDDDPPPEIVPEWRPLYRRSM